MNPNRYGRISLALAIFLPVGLPLSRLAQERYPLPIPAELYLQRLQTVEAETLKSEYEIEFLLLLDAQEKQYFEALSLAERRGYIERYWRLRDPDPFTPNNERLEEHLRRREFAREHFKKAEAPLYFDDRGKIYLKYGRPNDRYIDPGIYMQENRELSIFLPDEEYFSVTAAPDTGVFARGSSGQPLRTRVTSADLLPPGKVIVLENETWSYEHLQPGLVFNFVRQGTSFKSVTDLSKAVTGGRERYRILQATVMYLRRQNLSRVYRDLSRDLEDTGQRLRTQPGGLQLRLLDNEIRLAINQSIFALEDITRKSPPEAFVRKTKDPELPFVADIAQFRGDQNRTRVAIGIGANLGASPMAIDSTGGLAAPVSYSYVLSDRNGKAIDSAELKKSVPATFAGMPSVLGSVAMMELDCAPDQYIMAVQAVEAKGARKGMVKLPLLVRDFHSLDLMLSDIQFYVSLPGTAPDAEVSPGSLEPKTVLYPFTTILKSIPLTVYFEIYNLSKIGLNNAYRIDYNVTESSKKNLLRTITKPFRKNDEASITLSERRTVSQPTSRESLTLDFGRLRPGAYQLEVRVSAAQDSSLVAGATKSFVLVEEKR